MKNQRFIILVIMLGLLFGMTTSVFAQRRRGAPVSYGTLLVQWTPQEQLSSIVDDIRTVNLQMNITTDRQFWAMDISCIVDQPNIFEPDAGNQIMTWGSGWLEGTDTTFFDSTRHSDNSVGSKYYDSTTNRINASVTRVGASNAPFGLNGTTYTQLLFNLELTIALGLTDVTDVSLNCDKIVLLDRNGTSVGGTGEVITPTYQNILTIRDGYKLSGSATRQGSTNQNDIEVSCDHILPNGTVTNTYIVTTETVQVLDSRGRVISEISGAFSFENEFGSEVNPLREFGLYECTFTSKIDDTEDTVYLRGRSFINLQTPEYTLQPIVLPGGDTMSGDNTIEIVNDPTPITNNWLATVTPFTNGDVNGDGLVNEVDLTIMASNVGLQDDPDAVMLDHVLYNVARDYEGTFPNNTLAMGGVLSGEVNKLSDSRIFWAQVSPDGSQVAYYANTLSYVDRRGNSFSAPGRGLTPVEQIGMIVSDLDAIAGTVIASGTSFAPSWSPSGGMIAYICSWEGLKSGVDGYYYNNGDLCIVSSSGGTPQRLIPSGALSTYAEIFPPAWYNETTIVYGGNENHPLCPDQLCYYDVLTNTHGKLAINGIPDGDSIKANMPVIVRFDEGLAHLFYRYFTSTDSELRMGTVEYNSGTNSWAASGIQSNAIGSAYLHETVDGSDGGVHYYDVSPMRDVMFYEFGDYQFTNLYFEDTGGEFQWNPGGTHLVDGFIGYPMTNENNNIWDGFNELFAGTDFHAFRATIDWLP